MHIGHGIRDAARAFVTFAVLAFDCVRGTCPSYFCGICTPLTEVGGRVMLNSIVLHTAGTYMRAIYEDSIWQMQFPSCCTQNMELFTATSPFANHQPTTVPVWAQNSSLQTRLHMTFTSENY